MAEKRKTMKQFILELLEISNKPLHIQDFVDAFKQAGYETTRESVRGRINELTYDSSILRLGDGNYIKKPVVIGMEGSGKTAFSETILIQQIIDWFYENHTTSTENEGYLVTALIDRGYKEKLKNHENAGKLIEAASWAIKEKGTFFWEPKQKLKTKIGEASNLSNLTVPNQELGANVAIIDGKISATNLSPEKTNPNREMLEQLHADLLDKSRISANLITPTDNQYPELGLSVHVYRENIDNDLDSLNLTTVFIKGADLKADYETLEIAISKDKYDEYPELPQKIRSALRKQLEAHARFIGMSEEGGKLLDAFAKANRTPKAEREYREALGEFGKVIATETELIDPELATTILTLANTPASDPNQQSMIEVAGRYSRHILILTGTVATIGIAAGGIIAGLATANPILLGAGGLAAAAYELTIKEAYKKSYANKDISGLVTKGMNKFSSGDIDLLGKVMSFLRASKEKIRPIAKENALDEWFLEIHNEDESASKDWRKPEFYITELQEVTESLDYYALAGIIDYLMPALANRDVSLVACSDPHERDRIAAGFCAKKLDLKLDEAVDLVNMTCQLLQRFKFKHRVIFYYLIAESSGKLGLFHSERF